MTRWVSYLYRQEGKIKNIDDDVIENSLQQAHILQDKGFPAVLTLGHLAFHTGVHYSFLRKIVTRNIIPYRTFSIQKRGGGYRYINVPYKDLLSVQRWMDKFILSKISCSPFSFAFNKGQSIVECAEQHLGCTWLIKLDLRHFFESLSEIQVYRVFSSIGYNKLLAFEMARLTTKVSKVTSAKYKKANWISKFHYPIDAYDDRRIGHLPQGAATSPKLSNIIMRDLDYEISEVVKNYNITFTRYADDIAFSTNEKNFNRIKGLEIIRQVYSLLPKYGLRPNPQKAKIIPPGARKIVLGLLVDSDKVLLSKSFRNNIECHLYFCNKDLIAHCNNRRFDSVIGMKNYIRGLLSFAEQVDSAYKDKILEKYGEPSWPV